MSSTATSLWRVAGMSYLQYVNKSAAVVRSALKEPLRSKVKSNESFEFAAFKWDNGVRGAKTEIKSLKEAADAFKAAA